MKDKDCSLREKKHAKTKLAIMNAFMERLKQRRFDDISIKKVCEDAEVAEGTFFNYFPEKIDVICYYVRLMTLKTIWKARKSVSSGRYLPLIEALFNQLSQELDNDKLTYQILAALLAQSERPKNIAVSELEKSMAFPDCPGIEETPAVVLDEWFTECVSRARKNGELPLKTRVNDVVVSLMTIISGTLLAVRFCDSKDCGYHYKRQLEALWQCIGAGALDN